MGIDEKQGHEARRSARVSGKPVTTYNVQILTGTAVHTRTKYLATHLKRVYHGPEENLGRLEHVKSTGNKIRLRIVIDNDDLVQKQIFAEIDQAKRPREKKFRMVGSANHQFDKDLRKEFINFKLPFDIYNPLPHQVKVEGWVKLGKNKLIGDAAALWKRSKQAVCRCCCNETDGCGGSCHNRIMAYECNDTNCGLVPEKCNNRHFSELKRRAKGNHYDYGVEVMNTEDRGYGVRAMRTFQPHQVIVEYAGEIITQQECERRMRQVYMNDKCYYLMSFENNLIIDATRGTIARFVNHSCEPNCEMVKWIVNGEPRIALFAGPREIMTGEELTYDYNFSPFSQKALQECRCRTKTCRGVLGPKRMRLVKEEFAIRTS